MSFGTSREDDPMRIAASAVAFLLLAGPALADVTLICLTDLPGGGDRRRDAVTVRGAETLAQACQALRGDPQFAEYNWRTCVGPGGVGSCANPGDVSVPGPGTPPGPPPGPGPGMPPSPPIGPLSREPNIDRSGQDYARFALGQPDVEQCRLTCERDSRCAAYTYVHPGIQGPTAICWLKSAVPPPSANSCCISGTR
jgi:hypothetical protein